MKNCYKIPEVEVFLGSNLNFTLRIFTWGPAKDHDKCKKDDEVAKHINLSNIIINTINLK